MKHYMIILIAEDNAFGETHPFMIKTYREIRIYRDFHKSIKISTKIIYSIYHTYLWMTEMFPAKIKSKSRVPTSITAVQDSSVSSISTIRQKTKYKTYELEMTK